MGRRKGIFGRSKDSNNDRKKNQAASSSSNSNDDGRSSSSMKRSSSGSSNSRRRSNSIASAESDVSPKSSSQQKQKHHDRGGEVASPEVLPKAIEEEVKNRQALPTSSSSVSSQPLLVENYSGSNRKKLSALPVVSEDVSELPIDSKSPSSKRFSNTNLKNMKKESDFTTADDTSSHSAVSRNSSMSLSTTMEHPPGLPYLSSSEAIHEHARRHEHAHRHQHQHEDNSENRTSSKNSSMSQSQSTQSSNPKYPHIPPSFVPSDQVNPHPAMPNIFVTRLPPVNIAIEEVWRVDINDFQSGARALKLLFRTIENDGFYNSEGGNFPSYDPSEVFMCVKTAAESYRSHWVEIKTQQEEKVRAFELKQNKRRYREEQRRKRKIESKNSLTMQQPSSKGSIDQTVAEQTLENSLSLGSSTNSALNIEANASHETTEKNDEGSEGHSSKSPSASSSSGRYPNEDRINEEVWIQIEQVTWEIWELAVHCIASLAKFCVGPAWHDQLKKRQQRILSKQHSSMQQNLDRSNHSISTIGLESTATSSRRSVSYHRPFTFADTHQIEENAQYSPVSSTGSNPQSAASRRGTNGSRISEECRFPRIPEVLPAAMLRFVAEFGDSIAVPIHSQDSPMKLILNTNLDSDETKDVIDLNDYSDCIMNLIWSEQRCLIRRQRIGEAQRDIVMALCYAFPDVQSDNISVHSFQSNRSDRRSSQESVKFATTWSIPGAHLPVSTMIRGWVETAIVGWPVELTQGDVDERSQIYNTEEAFLNRLPCEVHNFVRDPSNVFQIEVLWSSISKAGAIDWWYSYQVTKFVFDLVSAGWRPPPNGKDGEEGILGLTALAEKGIMFHSSDMKYPKDETIEEAREERIAAASSAAEAMSALSSLSSRGFLPASKVSSIASTLCRLLAATDSSISNVYDTDLFPLNSASYSEEKDLLEEQGAFIAQRESSLRDIAEMTWAMLAHFSSMGFAADSLLNVIARLNVLRISKTQTVPEGVRSDIFFSQSSYENHAFSACGAIRALGASLWGNPPQVKGIPSLRIYWHRFLRLLAETSSSQHDWSSCDISPLERPTVISSSSSFSSRRSISSGDSRGIDYFKTIPPLAPLSTYQPAVLVLVLEIALALRRLVDGEMREGTGNLSPPEFVPFISLLEQGFLPWLAHFNIDDISDEKDTSPNFFRNVSLAEKIQSEVLGIFNQVQNFLTVRDNSMPVQIVDENARRRMHLLYFRMVSPLLYIEDSIFVSISVIDSWVYGGAVSHRGRDWQKKCADLLAEAFAVYDDRSHGFSGGYVHAPVVRRAAIRSFVDAADSAGPCQSEQSTRSGSEMDPYLVAKYARNIHLELVCSVMFPFLAEIILNGSQRHGLVLKNPVLSRHQLREDSNNINRSDDMKAVEDDQYILQKTAIQIVGDFLLSDVVERHNKTRLIELLREFLSDVELVSQQVDRKGKKVFKKHDEMISEILNTSNQASVLKLEAVSQLGSVFEATFEKLAQLHSFVPLIVQVFNEILVLYNKSPPTLGLQVVSLAAIFQLSRLKMSRSKRAMIVDQKSVLLLLPPTTAATISWMKGLMNSINSSHNFCEISADKIDDQDDLQLGREFNVAPFLKIDTLDTKKEETPTNRSSRSRQLGSSLNLQPLLETIRTMLHNDNSDGHVIYGAMYSLDSELRTISYEIISSFILCGIIQSPIEQWSGHICSVKASHVSRSEIVSRSKLLYCSAAFATRSSDDDQLSMLFRDILTCCSSNNTLVSTNGCRALSKLLSAASLSNADKKELNSVNSSWGQEACDILLTRIQGKVDNFEMDGSDEIENEVSSLVPLLSTLFNILSAYHLNTILSDRVKAKIVIISIQICSTFDEREETAQLFLLSLQCSAAAMSSMTSEEMKRLLPHVSERRTMSRVTESEIVDIMFDLLIQQNMERHEFKQTDGDGASYDKHKNLLTANERVAADNEEIEAFAVENDDSNSAAWRYGDMVLTCRIGARKSRYRGWVELIVRSPCTRVRRLVKLSGHTSLGNPNFPSPLWDRLSTAKEKRKTILSSFQFEKVQSVDTKIISLAKDAVHRCDCMAREFQTTDPQVSNDNSFNTNSLRTFLGLDLEDAIMKRALSVGDLNQKNSFQDLSALDSDLGNDSSVRRFLSAALQGNEENIIEVENEINRLDGASSSVLDSFYAQNEEMRKLKNSPQLRRAIAILDRAAFLQTHKIALQFLGASTTCKKEIKGKGKKDEDRLLSATNSSPSFSQFCEGLGDLTPLLHLRHFSGGLDTSDYASDGNFALSWISQGSESAHDLIGKIMVLFHSVPLMPPGLNNRKRHVGNDVVHIVYVEDTEVPTFDNSDHFQYDISGEFCFVTIFVTPSKHSMDMVKVSVSIRDDLDEKIMRTLQHLAYTQILLPRAVAPFHVRQIAIRADLSCRSVMQDRLGLFSNWQERLQQIRALDRYVEK